MSAQEFIALIAQYAVEDMRETGVLASITIAQAALESAWGRSAPGNNLFGIKGSGQTQSTQEYADGEWITIDTGFRAYDSWAGSIRDHSAFLTENGRYARAGFFTCCIAKDYAGAARALQRAGYATDPNYADKLIAIIEANALYEYDKEAEPVLDAGVAQTIINTWISPAWHATEDQQQKDYLHWLANQLRIASGQPEE